MKKEKRLLYVSERGREKKRERHIGKEKKDR